MKRPTRPSAEHPPRRRKARPTPPPRIGDSHSSNGRAHTGSAPDVTHSIRGRFSPKRIAAVLAAVATTIGVLSSTTSLFDWLNAKVSPATPPPAKIDASVTTPMLLSASKPLSGYLSETNQPADGLDAFQLAERGYEFLVGIHLQGNRGQRIILRWSIVNDATGNPLPGPTYNQDAAILRARNQDQARQWPIWTPSPPTRGQFLLRVVLLDDKRRPLAEADSKPFTQTDAPST